MRRDEREVTDPEAIAAILADGTVCHLGFAVENEPYVVPVSYGYADGVIYVHCAPEGRKLDMLQQNARVCFEVTAQEELVRRDTPCAWGFGYRSVIGWGQGRLLSDARKKAAGMDAIMTHYGGEGPFEYQASALDLVVILAIEITEMTGKAAVQSP